MFGVVSQKHVAHVACERGGLRLLSQWFRMNDWGISGRQFSKAAGSDTNVENLSEQGLKNGGDPMEESTSNKDSTLSEEKVASSSSSLVPKLVVFGGSGFVGTKVCENAIHMGADVVSVSRSGRPSFTSGAGWANEVEWVRSDVTKEDGSWRDALKDATGVVSTIGAFGTNAFMYKMCGEVNMNIIEAAKEADVSRAAFISVHEYSFPAGWQAHSFLLKGYFQGKRDVEKKLAEIYPDGGVALRPGFIYGTRHAGGMKIPLGLAGVPMQTLLKPLPTKSLSNIPIIGAAFVPPVSVQSVGKAAASAILDSSIKAGIMDVWEISKYN